MLTSPAGTAGDCSRRHRSARRVTRTLALVIAATLALSAGYASGVRDTQASAAGPTTTASTVTASATTCSATAIARLSSLTRLRATVYSEDDLGTPLFDTGGTTLEAQASVMKLVTSVVATEVLGDDYQFSTTVYAGKKKGTIIIVGSGDPTLSRTGKSVYSGAPSMKTLAKKIRAWSIAKNIKVTKIVVDTSAYDSANLKGPWYNSDISEGYVSRISALMVDGDRATATSRISARSTNPAKTAGTTFRAAVYAALRTASTPTSVRVTSRKKISVTYRTATRGSSIATVKSQKLSTLLQQMLPYSDNTLAEALAIRVTKNVTGVASYTKVNAAYHTVLTSLGISATGMTFRDGSGMTKKNRMSTTFLATLMHTVYTTDADASIVSALPVVRKKGTLGWSGRFKTSSKYTSTRNSELIAARRYGAITGKDGYLNGLLSLTGTLVAADGTRLYFSVTSIDSKFYQKTTGLKTFSQTYPAIDYLIARFYTCGARLVDYGK